MSEERKCTYRDPNPRQGRLRTSTEVAHAWTDRDRQTTATGPANHRGVHVSGRSRRASSRWWRRRSEGAPDLVVRGSFVVLPG